MHGLVTVAAVATRREKLTIFSCDSVQMVRMGNASSERSLMVCLEHLRQLSNTCIAIRHQERQSSKTSGFVNVFILRVSRLKTWRNASRAPKRRAEKFGLFGQYRAKTHT